MKQFENIHPMVSPWFSFRLLYGLTGVVHMHRYLHMLDYVAYRLLLRMTGIPMRFLCCYNRFLGFWESCTRSFYNKTSSC